MKLVFGHDATVTEWAARQNGGLGRQPDYAWGVIDADGVLVGALLLHVYNPWTAELEVHGKTSNDVAKEFFGLVFGPMGVERLEVKTTRNNKTVKKNAPKWGFVFDGSRKRYYGPLGDALAYYMTPETCRWLTHGKQAENA